MGSLPSIGRKEKSVDHSIRFPKGQNKYPFTFDMQVPKSSCFVAYQNEAEYNLSNIIMVKAIEHVLGLRYTETIREKEGGTYGVSAGARLQKTPINQVLVNMYFDTDPEKADHLVGIIHSEFQKVIKDGPTEEDLNKAREYFLKSRSENLRENRFWSSAIRDYYSNGIDQISEYEELVRKLTPKDVQKAAKKLFKKANMIEVIMSPEK